MRIPQSEIDELLAIVETVRPQVEPPRTGVQSAVGKWAETFAVTSGGANGVGSEVLYRHFQQWCAAENAGAYDLGPTQWGRHLTLLGLAKGREFIKGHDIRPRLMSQSSAAYFRQWEKENPGEPRKVFGNKAGGEQ